jgi:hypothetical protein
MRTRLGHVLYWAAWGAPLVIPAALLGGCAVSPDDAVRDSATAIQIARAQCGDETQKWRATLSGDYWVVWSDKLLEVMIAKHDGTVTECALSIP